MQIKKVFIIGQVIGSYRSQNYIKALLDLNYDIHFSPYSYIVNKKKHSFLQRFIYLVLFIPRFLVKAWLISYASHVLVLPMNYSWSIFIEIFLAKALQKIIIVDYYIGVYDTFVNDRKTLTKGSRKANSLFFRDRLLMRLATKLVFLNSSEMIFYHKVLDLVPNEEKSFICPLVVDPKFVGLSSNDKIQKANKFTICWWGTYIPLHGLERIIEAFSFIKSDSVELIVLGDSDEKSLPYNDLVKKLNLQAKISIRNDLSFASGNLASFLYENCDLALGNFGNSEKAKTVLVNKLVDALSMGLPCLTLKTKAAEELLNNDCVIYCDSDPIDIAKNIESLIDRDDYLKSIGKKGFQLYLKSFTPDVFRERINELFQT